MNESGWVIERYVNSELRYWNGQFTDTSRGFSSDHKDAIRFAREHDASYVLSWLLEGNGRVAEHVWSETHDA